MADAINIISTPKFDSFELVKTGTINVDLSSIQTQSTTTISHGLGYTPVYLAYIQISTIYHQIPLTLFDTATSNREVYDIYVDENNITARITVQTAGTTKDIDFRYYLFRVTAKPV